MEDTNTLLEMFEHFSKSFDNNNDTNPLLEKISEAKKVLQDNGDDPEFQKLLNEVFDPELYKTIIDSNKSELGCDAISSIFKEDTNTFKNNEGVPEDLRSYLDDFRYLLEHTSNMKDVTDTDLTVIIKNIEKETKYTALIPTFRFNWQGYIEATIVWEDPEQDRGINWVVTLDPNITKKKLRSKLGIVNKDSLLEIHRQLELYN